MTTSFSKFDNPLIVFVSSNALTRKLISNLLKEKWSGQFKIFSSIEKKSLNQMNIYLLLLDLSERFPINHTDLKNKLANVDFEVCIFYEYSLEEYINKINSNRSRAFTLYRKPVEKQDDFVKSSVAKYIEPINAPYISQMISNELNFKKSPHLIAIGASTGGPDALVKIVKNLQYDMPPILIIVHMPPNFIKGFCKRLQSLTTLEIKPFEENQVIEENQILIASGRSHMVVDAKFGQFHIKKGGAEKVNGHCPSIDVLFDSISKLNGVYVVGALLTGMGKDGAKGLLKIKNSGGLTIVQDKKSSEIFGMPKAAIDINAAQVIMNLENISQIMRDYSLQNNA